MGVEPDALAAGVDELRALLQADGADLHIVGVHLRLDIADAECVECVLPPDLLDQMVREGLRRRVGPELDVIFEDPRRPA